jgi:hypothetical protein
MSGATKLRGFLLLFANPCYLQPNLFRVKFPAACGVTSRQAFQDTPPLAAGYVHLAGSETVAQVSDGKKHPSIVSGWRTYHASHDNLGSVD